MAIMGSKFLYHSYEGLDKMFSFFLSITDLITWVVFSIEASLVDWAKNWRVSVDEPNTLY